MPHRLTYAGVPLDRAGELRENLDWIVQQQRSDKACVLALWNNGNLTRSGENPEAISLRGDQAQALFKVAADPGCLPPIFLGLQKDMPVFAMDLSHLEEHAALQVTGFTPDQAVFTDLRTFGALVDHGLGSMLAMARGLIYWHQRHLFCGACGAPTLSKTAGHVRHCTNDQCGLDHFPRTDPAVIMLVTATIEGIEHCLLGRQASWAKGRYSSLAGFVEPGESLETAVLREVLEESGIKATDARYMASQPWPFPSSLMIGFRARAHTLEIDTSTNELEHARWFSHAEIMRMREGTNQEAHIISSSDSIARWLIEDWIKNP